MIEYRYDTQLLVDGEDLDEDAINDYLVENFKGDCLLAVAQSLGQTHSAAQIGDGSCGERVGALARVAGIVGESLPAVNHAVGTAAFVPVAAAPEV